MEGDGEALGWGWRKELRWSPQKVAELCVSSSLSVGLCCDVFSCAVYRSRADAHPQHLPAAPLFVFLADGVLTAVPSRGPRRSSSIDNVQSLDVLVSAISSHTALESRCTDIHEIE